LIVECIVKQQQERAQAKKKNAGFYNCPALF